MRFTLRVVVLLLWLSVTAGAGSGLGMSGVMMRESLDSGARNVTTCTSPLGSACFNARTATNAPSGPRYRFACTDSWVKLERKRSIITAFTSTDGRGWKSTSTTTVAMNASVDVGLCCAAYQNGYGMQTTTFDNVRVLPVTASRTK